MLSIDGFREQVDLNFQQSIDDFQTIGMNMDHYSADDIQLFNEANRQTQVASWAANQEVVMTHNLVKALIDEIR